MNDINWREPLWLAMAAIPWLFLSIGWLRGKFFRQYFAENKFLPWVIANRSAKVQLGKIFHFAVLVLAWLCFAIAMAGPRSVSVIHAKDNGTLIDVMLVIDVSRSMSAGDIQPSRIKRVQLELTDLLRRSQGMRFGMVVFAAQAHLLVPVTTDKQVLASYLKNLRTGLLPTEGSNVTAALRYAQQQLMPGTSSMQKAILLVSDGGEETASDNENLDSIIAGISRDNIKIYTLGVGTLSGSSLLDSDSGWLKDDEQVVTTRLNSSLLQTIALRGKGKYSAVSDSDSEWRSLYNNGLSLHRAGSDITKADSSIEWQEHYHVWLLAGFILFLLAHVRFSFGRKVQHVMLTLIVVFIASIPLPQNAVAGQQHELKSAYSAFREQQYGQAEKLYKDIQGYQGRIGEGGSAYLLGRYNISIRNFILAVLEANSDQQRADALFNLANSYFKTGRYSEAVVIYQDVLVYIPNYKPARINLEYAKSLAKKRKPGDSGSASSRTGRGPRTGKAAEDLDLSQGGLSLGDATNNTETGLPDAGTGSKQLSSRPESIESTAQEKSEFADENWQYQKTDTRTITAYINHLEIDETVFWQRMFELEEGFVAPIEKPREVPGNKPW